MAEDDDGGVDDADEDDGKVKAPIEQYEGVELGGLPPIAPDGGFAPDSIGMPVPIPAATPENFICLRGPCEHYWEIQTFVVAGNPADTWGPDGLKDLETGLPLRAPRQLSRSCLAHPGTETELTEDCVFECNRWSPMTAREVRAQKKRRSKHLKLFPNHRPKE